MLKRRVVFALLISVISISKTSAVAPSPPLNLTATVSGNDVTFAWQLPSTGGMASSYVLDAALSPGGVAVASLPVTGSPFVVPGVPTGVYYVAARGVNADGSSQRSNEVVVSVPSGSSGCNAAPNPPTALTASAVGNLVTLLWSAPPAGCPATGYVVQAGTAPGLTDLAVINVGAATTLSASAELGTYYIRVIAVNPFGGSGATSDVVLGVGIAPPPPAPAPPTSRFRVGAVCNDSTLSTATGSGACSSHGGVRCWRYSDGGCTFPDVRDPF